MEQGARLMGRVETLAVAIPKWFLNLIGVALIPTVTLVGWLVVSVVKLQSDSQNAERDRDRIALILEDQTRELVALRLEIERLMVVKPSDVYKKLEELEKRWESMSKNWAGGTKTREGGSDDYPGP